MFGRRSHHQRHHHHYLLQKVKSSKRWPWALRRRSLLGPGSKELSARVLPFIHLLSWLVDILVWLHTGHDTTGQDKVAHFQETCNESRADFTLFLFDFLFFRWLLFFSESHTSVYFCLYLLYSRRLIFKTCFMLLFDFNRLTTNTCKESGFSHKNRLLSKNERSERWLGCSWELYPSTVNIRIICE